MVSELPVSGEIGSLRNNFRTAPVRTGGSLDIPPGFLLTLEPEHIGAIVRVALSCEIPDKAQNSRDELAAAGYILAALKAEFEADTYVFRVLIRQWSDSWDMAKSIADFRRSVGRRAA
jgi:hypothetical protein